MKKGITLLLCLTGYLCTHAQELKKPKNMVLVPSGALNNITIQDFYISNEITNSQFRAFVHYLKQNPADSLMAFEYINGNVKTSRTRNADILKNSIDTNVMNGEIKNYFTDKAYNNYPVVGISFNAATLYCAWKSKYRIDNYVTRLPTTIEWKYAATYSQPDCNVTTKPQAVANGKPNKLGVFHLNDNVSEWTSDKAIMGNSWKSNTKPMDKLQISNNTKNNFTGFRIVETYLGNSR